MPISWGCLAGDLIDPTMNPGVESAKENTMKQCHPVASVKGAWEGVLV